MHRMHRNVVLVFMFIILSKQPKVLTGISLVYFKHIVRCIGQKDIRKVVHLLKTFLKFSSKSLCIPPESCMDKS